jgi:hypothetical protein
MRFPYGYGHSRQCSQIDRNDRSGVGVRQYMEIFGVYRRDEELRVQRVIFTHEMTAAPIVVGFRCVRGIELKPHGPIIAATELAVNRVLTRGVYICIMWG